MISSSHRLRAKEVVEVLKKGRGIPSSTSISAKVFYPNTLSGGTIRSAAVVSLKVARSNVTRNRLRRALYDSVQKAVDRQPSTNFMRTAHVVFFVRSVPKGNLRESFAADVKHILSSLTTNN